MNFSKPCPFECTSYCRQSTDKQEVIKMHAEIQPPIILKNKATLLYADNGKKVLILSTKAIKDFGKYEFKFTKTQGKLGASNPGRYFFTASPKIERTLDVPECRSTSIKTLQTHLETVKLNEFFKKEYTTDVTEDIICKHCKRLIFTVNQWNDLTEIFNFSFEAVEKYLSKLGLTKADNLIYDRNYRYFNY